MFGDPVRAGLLMLHTHWIVFSTVGYIDVVQSLRTGLVLSQININCPHPPSRDYIKEFHLAVYLHWSSGSVDPVVPRWSGGVAAMYLLAGSVLGSDEGGGGDDERHHYEWGQEKLHFNYSELRQKSQLLCGCVYLYKVEVA